MSRKLLVGIASVLLILTSIPTVAQDDVIATGLNNPRHLFYASDGTLYIAEAGSGGEETVQGPFGEATGGNSAQISAVSLEGEWSVVIPELLSTDLGFGQIEGSTSIYVTETSIWATLGIGPQEIPDGQYAEAVVEFDLETKAVTQSIDFRAWEAENNPDEAPELVSNPVDLAVDADGKIYIADASGNSLLTWTADEGLSLFLVWPVVEGEPSAVPTSVSIGPDGDIYIGFLTGFPFPTGGARIERYSPEGELKQTYEGLTLVTDVLVTADGTIYAVQFADGFGDTGYNAGTGSVVVVGEDGPQVVYGQLNFPYGIAVAPDGTLAVTVDTYGQPPNSGQVFSIGM